MSKAIITGGWDDVPHLKEKQKAELLKAFPENQRNSRTKGIPSKGSGAIYPIDDEEVSCKPIPIPSHWPRSYALDVGWNRTAALWGARDLETDVLYLYSEHYRGQAEPSIHATAIRGRGDWITGVIDPAARGRSQKDGTALLDIYKDLGLKLTPAVNSVEAGIYATWERLSTGRLKVFSTLENFWTEFGLYRRDEDGKIIKEGDHLMDAMRYLVMSGLEVAIVKPAGSVRHIKNNAYTG